MIRNFQHHTKLFRFASLTRREQRSLVFHLLYIMDAFEYTVDISAVVDNMYQGLGIILPRQITFFMMLQR